MRLRSSRTPQTPAERQRCCRSSQNEARTPPPSQKLRGVAYHDTRGMEVVRAWGDTAGLDNRIDLFLLHGAIFIVTHRVTCVGQIKKRHGSSFTLTYCAHDSAYAADYSTELSPSFISIRCIDMCFRSSLFRRFIGDRLPRLSFFAALRLDGPNGSVVSHVVDRLLGHRVLAGLA